MSQERPHLAPLWAAVICSGQARQLLSLALQSLLPLCLVAALWTNTVQTFLQIDYNRNKQQGDILPLLVSLLLRTLCGRTLQYRGAQRLLLEQHAEKT